MKEETLKQNILCRIQYLQELLKGRREEYKMFGATQQDVQEDINTQTRIEELQRLI